MPLNFARSYVCAPADAGACLSGRPGVRASPEGADPNPTLKKFQGRWRKTTSGLVREKASPMEVSAMPTPVKTTAMMAKNMTEAELEARLEAENEVLPDRGRNAQLVIPKLMAGNAAARRYWKQILERMQGLVILDDLDSEMLGVYCSMLAREELLCREFQAAAREVSKSDALDDRLAALGKLDAMSGKLQSLERNILQYAEKLGLTPSGRVRLAQKRAEAAAAEVDPDGDLYG